MCAVLVFMIVFTYGRNIENEWISYTMTILHVSASLGIDFVTSPVNR